MERYDVVIVGAGPAGLAAACQAQDLGLSYVVLDRKGLAHSFVEYPQALRFFSPADEMAVGGVPFPMRGGDKPAREDALAYYRAVAHSRGINLAPWEEITAFERTPSGCRVTTVRGPSGCRVVERDAAAVVLCTGVWPRPRRLACPGADLPHVYARFTEPTDFYGCPVLVVGGGNSAFTAALSLADAHARVTLVTRRAPAEYQNQLRPFVLRDMGFAVEEGAVDLHTCVQVHAVEPEAAWLVPIDYDPVECRPCGEPYRVEARFVFALLGFVPDPAFLCLFGLPSGPDGRPPSDPETYETPVRGLYVAGSLAHRDVDIVLKGREQASQVLCTIAARLGRA